MILESVKKSIGFDADYRPFDRDIVVQINAALSVLKQIGVQVNGSVDVSGEQDWSDILGDDVDIEMIKNYIYLKVRLIFDPPLNASILQTIKDQIKEYEYRINLEVETGERSERYWNTYGKDFRST